MNDSENPTVSDLPPQGEEPYLYRKGQRIGPYLVVGPLGQGGMSQVYEVEHSLIRHRAALKVLKPSMATHAGRLLTEGKAMARVHHPNVVGVHVAFYHESRLCLVLERVEGGDLKQLAPLERREHASALFRGIVEGVRAVHRRDVLHRDLKPANVLIDRVDQRLIPKVVDFGIARLEGISNATAAGRPFGTPEYSAPEQQEAGVATLASDLWSLGAILHFLFTGSPPFVAHTMLALQAAKMKGLTSLPAGLTPAEARVLETCLAPNPADRYATCDELLDELASDPVPLGPPHFSQEPHPSIEDLIETAEPLRTHDLIADWMDPFLEHCRTHQVDPLLHPRFLRLRQQQALALARSGATRSAQHILQGLRTMGVSDAETLGILARTYKDLAFQAPTEAARYRHLVEALSLYEEGYQGAQHRNDPEGSAYTGINYATCLYLAGYHAESQRVAEEVRHLCAGQRPRPGHEYHHRATLAEACFLLERHEAGFRHLARAAVLGQGRTNALASTRLQLRRILAETKASPTRMELETRLQQALPVPPVVSFTARSEDMSMGEVRDFLDGLESRISLMGKAILYCPAASSLDLQFLERMWKYKAEIRVFLPYGRSRLDLAPAEGPTPSDWRHALGRALDQADDVVILNRYTGRAVHQLCAFTRQCVEGEAVERARAIWSPIFPVRDVEESLEMDTADGDCGLDGAVHHGHRAFLLTSLKEWGRLDEEAQIRFVGALVRLIRDTADRPGSRFAMSRIAGDQALLVFDSVEAALQAAFVIGSRTIRWESLGLAPGTRLRLALHAGPCTSYREPNRDARDLCGSHLDLASMLARSTPPGEVWASRHFTALCAARRVKSHRFEYAGTVAIPWHDGHQGVYHVRPAEMDRT